jgi:hypothetical protein
MQKAQAHTSTHTIHVLSGGTDGRDPAARSLCGKPPGTPPSWPAAHLYVRIPAGLGCPTVVNCPACIQAFQDRLR